MAQFKQWNKAGQRRGRRRNSNPFASIIWRSGRTLVSHLINKNRMTAKRKGRRRGTGDEEGTKATCFSRRKRLSCCPPPPSPSSSCARSCFARQRRLPEFGAMGERERGEQRKERTKSSLSLSLSAASPSIGKGISPSSLGGGRGRKANEEEESRVAQGEHKERKGRGRGERPQNKKLVSSSCTLLVA